MASQNFKLLYPQAMACPFDFNAYASRGEVWNDSHMYTRVERFIKLLHSKRCTNASSAHGIYDDVRVSPCVRKHPDFPCVPYIRNNHQIFE